MFSDILHKQWLTNSKCSVNRNGTYSGDYQEDGGVVQTGNIAHVGQIYFDESLRSAVEATYPYYDNKAAIVSNNDDQWAPDEAERNYDPFPEWAYLGDSVTDGLLMWISVGINMSASYNISVAGSLTSSGGISSGNSGGFGNGTIPSGAPPSASSSGTFPPSVPSHAKPKILTNMLQPERWFSQPVGSLESDMTEEIHDRN